MADGTVLPRGELAPNMAAWRRPYIPGPLTEAEMEQFWVQGYVIKHGLLAETDLKPAVDSVAKLVDDVARRLHAAGKIADTAAEQPFEKRLIAIEAQFPDASVLLHKLGVLPTGVQQLWGNPKLLGVARQLLGADAAIAGHPVWNLRTKTPQNEQTVVPWHQDVGYLETASADTLQVTAWVPLVPATRENGCMEVLAHGHRMGKEVKHTCCVGGTWYVEISEGEVERVLGCDTRPVEEGGDRVLCACPTGSVLFLNNIIPHRSLSNVSDGVRWSLDLRWQRAEEPHGFWGLKDPIMMSPPGAGDVCSADWEAWARDDRQAKQMAAVAADPTLAEKAAADPTLAAKLPATEAGAAASGASTGKAPEPDAFDTTIAGPWMGKWELNHHNKHVQRYLEGQRTGAGTDWHSAGVLGF